MEKEKQQEIAVVPGGAAEIMDVQLNEMVFNPERFAMMNQLLVAEMAVEIDAEADSLPAARLPETPDQIKLKRRMASPDFRVIIGIALIAARDQRHARL